MGLYVFFAVTVTYLVACRQKADLRHSCSALIFPTQKLRLSYMLSRFSTRFYHF